MRKCRHIHTFTILYNIAQWHIDNISHMSHIQLGLQYFGCPAYQSRKTWMTLILISSTQAPKVYKGRCFVKLRLGIWTALYPIYELENWKVCSPSFDFHKLSISPHFPENPLTCTYMIGTYPHTLDEILPPVPFSRLTIYSRKWPLVRSPLKFTRGTYMYIYTIYSLAIAK